MTSALYPMQPGLHTRLCSTCREWKPTDDGRVWNRRRCPDCVSAYNAAYHNAHRDEHLARNAAYYIANRDERRAYKSACQTAYRQTEAGKTAQRRNDRNRRARKQNAVCKHGVGCFDDAARVMRRRCAACGKQNGIEPDHIIPLAQDGLDCKQNLQPLCRHCNAAKNARLIDAHATGYLI